MRSIVNISQVICGLIKMKTLNKMPRHLAHLTFNPKQKIPETFDPS